MRCIPALLLASLALAASGTSAVAQDSVTTGMTRDDVVSRRGTPLGERVVGDLTVLLYENACVPRCASNDVVILRQGRVLASLPAQPDARTGAPADSLTALLDADVFAPSMLSVPARLFPVYVADEFSTLRAPEPLRVRPYRLPGSFAPGEIAEFERSRDEAPRD